MSWRVCLPVWTLESDVESFSISWLKHVGRLFQKKTQNKRPPGTDGGFPSSIVPEVRKWEVWKALGLIEFWRESRHTAWQMELVWPAYLGQMGPCLHTKVPLSPVHTRRVFVNHNQQFRSALLGPLLSRLSSLWGNKWERRRCVTFKR